MAAVKIPIKSIAKDMIMSVKVTGLSRWKIRVSIGLRVIRFATWIMGVGVKIETPALGPHTGGRVDPGSTACILRDECQSLRSKK